MTRVVDQVGGVNLAQGMPNFPPPPELIAAAHQAIDGDFHQYAVTWGAPRLRQAIAEKYRKFYGMEIDPDRHVTVCCGSTETMLSTLLAVLNPGDEVIIFEPFYENYGPGCVISGAQPAFVPLEPPDFSFDPDRLRRAVTPRTRAIIFNSPNNPTGKVFSRDELTISSRSGRRIRSRKPRSRPSGYPIPTTWGSGSRTRRGAISSGATSRKPGSWRGSRGAPTTSSPTSPTF